MIEKQIAHPPEARATLNIIRPGEMSFAEQAELAEWLRDLAKVIMESEHEERSDGASMCMFVFVPDQGDKE